MIDQRFMDSLYSDMALSPSDADQARQDGVLLAQNKPSVELYSPEEKSMSYPNEQMTDTGGGAAVGYRLNMPKNLTTPEEAMTRAKGLPPALAATAKGAAQAAVGMYGDLEGLARDLINVVGGNVSEETFLPTTEKIKGILDQYIPMGKENLPYETTGEIVSPIGVVGAGLKYAKPIVKGLGKVVEAGKDLPVGMSIKPVGQGMDELGFYSAASKAVDSIAQEKGTGAQFLAQIQKTPGVKAEELKWTGLDDFLQSKKSVTKAEVQDYINANRVEIKEVKLGEQEAYDPARLKQLENEYANLKEHPIDDPSFGEDKYDELIKLMNIRDRSTTDSLYASAESATRAAQRAQAKGMKDAAEKYFREAEFYNTRAEKLDLNDMGMENPTKFSKYTLPGGENYREVLLTLPTNKARADNVDDAFNMWMADAKAGKRGQYTAEELASITKDDVLDILKEDYLTPSTKGEFRSQHFDQPNILAHMRLNDRVDADGKKVLFVEEVQSDWHQTGRKQGYEPENALKQKQELKAIQTERFKLQEEKMKLEELADPYVAQGQDAPAEIVDKWSAVSNRINQLQSAEDRLGRSAQKGVPDAPFKGSWHELAMKRAIQLASEGGYDRIAFTTGKTQAERYDLSKQIDEVYYNKTAKAFGAYKDGKAVMMKNDVEPSDLEDLIGKETAKKLLDAPIEKPTQKGAEGIEMQRLKGQQLQVGGEGMKGFYDTILPKFLDKYGKKWDAKTGMTEIPVGKGKPTQYADFEEYNKAPSQSNVSVHYMDITPKMKESVLTQGQPLFQVAPPLAGAAASQEEKK